MKNNELENTKNIIMLHNEIAEVLKKSLEKAILIGQLLIEQKKGLNKSEFTKYVAVI